MSLLFTGVLCATGITGCTLNSNSLNLNQCYNANTFFTTPLAVNWGAAFGTSDLSAGNPHTVGANAWTTNIAGVNVGVNVGSDFVSGTNFPGTVPQLARINNDAYVWDPGTQSWTTPQGLWYAGHFNAPSAPSGTTVKGDNLLEMYNGSGSFVITFDQGMSSVGLLVSVLGTGFNTNFNGVIKAYDQNSNLLSIYGINTVGVGGGCMGLNMPGITYGNPVPCNNAPFIGVRSGNAGSGPQIYKIVITASTGGNLDSLLLDSLSFQESSAPEPAVVFLCGTGLVLIGVLRRKRSRDKN